MSQERFDPRSGARVRSRTGVDPEPAPGAGRLSGSPPPQRIRVDGILLAGRPAGRAVPLVGSPSPAVSFEVPLLRQGQRQTGYQIRWWGRAEPGGIDDDTGPVVRSGENRGIAWDTRPLRPFDVVRLAVRTLDEHAQFSPWSDPVTVTAGPFTVADWAANWIAVPPTHEARTTADRAGAGPIDRAVLHLAGWGTLRASCQGTVVNADHLDPTDASLHRATSRAYDVTDLLASADGPIRLALVAGLGHYHRILERARLIAVLRIDYADGSVQTIGTDPGWTHAPTSLVADRPFYLEEHDARVGTRPDAGRVTLVAPDAVPPAPVLIEPDVGPPIRVVREVTAREIGRPAAGVRVFDVGENVAARVRLHLRAARPGQRIESVQGEKLADGRVDTTNIRLPDDRDTERQVLGWTCAGGEEMAEPWFGVRGFRFVEVRGLEPDTEVAVSAGVLHSDVERTGSLRTASPELTRLVDMAVRTQLNNTHGYPEDCPTREQGGWTGDAAVSAEAALSHLDLTGVYRNWLRDVELDMSPAGGVPGLTPIVQDAEAQQPADPVWGAAMTEIPWQMWQVTGDVGLVSPFLPAMRRWVDWQLGTLDDGVVRFADISFGADWLAFEQTPPVLLQTAAVVVSLRRLADLEEATGEPAAAARRREQADRVVAAARRELHDPDSGAWANDSQGSLAVAATTGLAPPAEVPALRQRLAGLVARRGGRLATGFSATRAAVRALADLDGGRALLSAVLEPAQPGIGAMLVDGPGTFWETWWIDDANVGVASLDHIGLAAPFAAWVWRDVAGLVVREPGFRRFALAPRLADRVPGASFRLQTVRGEIAADWSLLKQRFSARIEVPVGATAEVVVPGHSAAPSVDGRADHPLARLETDADGRQVVVVPAGRYLIEATGVRPIGPAGPAPEESTGEHSVEPRRSVGALWLSDGATSRWRSPDPADRIVTRTETVVCTPVYHEPIPGPTLDVEIADLRAGPDDPGQLLVLEQDGPLDLSRARTVFGHIDVDNATLPGRRLQLVLLLTGADGTSVVGRARPLPIQWNRVAVDVGDWPGRSQVTGVAIGVAWDDEPEPARGPHVPLPPPPHRFCYRLGRVGWSADRRTY